MLDMRLLPAVLELVTLLPCAHFVGPSQPAVAGRGTIPSSDPSALRMANLIVPHPA